MEKKKKLKDTAEMARQRSNIYGLLAVIFREELTSELIVQIKAPHFMGVLSDIGINLEDEFLNQSEEKLLKDLAVEYTRLFLGPGRHISPHESVHHVRDDGDWGRLWGKSTVEVKKFIESLGLECSAVAKSLPDHISVELELMQKLTQRECQAWTEGDRDGALYCLKLEKKFIEEHLIKWVPLFCDRVTSEAELPFYREIAKITRSFIEFEKENMEPKVF